KAKLTRELGAEAVVNYKAEDFAAKLKEAAGGAGIQGWYETQPPTDLDPPRELMAPPGRNITMPGRGARPVFPHAPFYVKGLSLLGFAMFNMTADEQRICAEDINKWLAAKQLKAIIGKRFSLAETAEAHRLQEDNTLRKAGTLTGKIIIL